MQNLVLGTDLVFIPRLIKSYDRYGEAFLLKFLTEKEWQDCQQASKKGNSNVGIITPLKKQCFHKAAGRIAIKEAVTKALGVGLNGLGWAQGIHWKEIEVIRMDKKAPQLCLYGKAKAFAEQQRIQGWRLSLSHDGQYAMATVIGLQ